MKRAFTLLEVMVAGALSFMLLVVLTQALIPLMRHTSQSMEHLELSQLTHKISQRLLEDLQSAPPSAIHFGPEEWAVQPLERITATGRPVYEDGLIVYSLRLEQGQLWRKRCNPDDLSLDHPTRFTPAQLDNFFQASAQPARTLVSEVLREFSLAPLPQRPQMVQLSFLLRGHSKQYRFDEVVALRNGER